MPAPKKPVAKGVNRFKALAKRTVSPLASWLSIGTLASLMGGWIFVDDRWAHAADVNQHFAAQELAASSNAVRSEVGQLKIQLQIARGELQGFAFQYPDEKRRPLFVRQELERRGEVVRDIGLELGKKQDLLTRLQSGGKP